MSLCVIASTCKYFQSIGFRELSDIFRPIYNSLSDQMLNWLDILSGKKIAISYLWSSRKEHTIVNFKKYFNYTVYTSGVWQLMYIIYWDLIYHSTGAGSQNIIEKTSHQVRKFLIKFHFHRTFPDNLWILFPSSDFTQCVRDGSKSIPPSPLLYSSIHSNG
jgi:hypothetical protein